MGSDDTFNVADWHYDYMPGNGHACGTPAGYLPADMESQNYSISTIVVMLSLKM